MDFFQTILFGVSGLSLIFWVAVIGLWHAEMFPRFFAEEASKSGSSNNMTSNTSIQNGDSIMPSMENVGIIGLFNRGKYSRRSFVVADFSPIEEGYSVNRLYAGMLLSLSAMTFIIIGYGLHSGFILPS